MTAQPSKVERGTVYFVELADHERRGSEQMKTRSWVVVSSKRYVNDRYPIIVGVPLSEHAKDNTPVHVPILEDEIELDPGQTPIKLIAMVEQVRVLAVERLLNRKGVITREALERVEAAMRLALDLP